MSVFIFILISIAMEGATTDAVVLRSLGPLPSKPVALDDSNSLIQIY